MAHAVSSSSPVSNQDVETSNETLSPLTISDPVSEEVALSPVHKRPKDDISKIVRPQHTASAVSQIDFPKKKTIKQIEREYFLFHDVKRILVLGPPNSGKSAIINAIIKKTDQHNMIESQYEREYAVITEHAMSDIAERAVPNLKFFPIIKDAITSVEIDEIPCPHGPLAFKTATDRARHDQQVFERRQKEAVRRRYGRLSDFSMKTLEDSTYPVIRTESDLCSGFIRELQAIENIEIPLEIVVLIEGYYESNKMRIDSFKFQNEEGVVYDLWESTVMDHSVWNQCNEKIDGTIFVVDLSLYDELFVDEDGRKWNKLEYVVSKSEERSSTKSYTKSVWFTNKDKLLEKVKGTPLSVCPLFSKNESTEAALARLTRRAYRECVDITNHSAIINRFKSMRRRRVQSKEQRTYTCMCGGSCQSKKQRQHYYFG